MQIAIPTVVMRGGTSKGLFFLAADLPEDDEARDQLLLKAMGSPDERQIDGMGGAHPLTSKVAIVSKSAVAEADIDYLFLQVFVDRALVSDGQNCGNILAGVGPFAIEQGLVTANAVETELRIRMLNSGGIAVVTIRTPRGQVSYEGDASIDGVPGSAAPVMIDFADVAGSNCGALLPTGNAIDEIDGVNVTCIDNGMPVVLVRAADLGKTGYESPDELEADESLREKVESIRLNVGLMMNLGDVADKTVPKVSLIAKAKNGGSRRDADVHSAPCSSVDWGSRCCERCRRLLHSRQRRAGYRERNSRRCSRRRTSDGTIHSGNRPGGRRRALCSDSVSVVTHSP